MHQVQEKTPKTHAMGYVEGKVKIADRFTKKETERAAKTQVKTRLEESVKDERYGEGHKSLIRIFNQGFLLCCETYCNLSKFKLVWYFFFQEEFFKIPPRKAGLINPGSGFL